MLKEIAKDVVTSIKADLKRNWNLMKYDLFGTSFALFLYLLSDFCTEIPNRFLTEYKKRLGIEDDESFMENQIQAELNRNSR